MSTGFKYINARVLLIFVIALSITVAILVGERLVHFLEKAANGSVPPKAIFLLVAFRFSELLQLVIPFVLSISISISLGALQESRELLSLQVAGLSNLRLLAWLSAPVLVLTVFVGIMSILTTPSARQMEESYISEYSNSQNTIAIQQGGFQKDNEWTLYQAKKPSIDEQSNVFAQSISDNGEHLVLWGSSLDINSKDQSGQQAIAIRNGVQIQTIPGESRLSQYEFDEIKIRFNQNVQTKSPVEGLPTRELIARGEHPEELFWRISLPIFTLLSALLAICRSRILPKKSQYSQVVPVFLYVAAYYMLLVIAKWSIENSSLSLAVGLIIPHLVCSGLILKSYRSLNQPIG